MFWRLVELSASSVGLRTTYFGRIGHNSCGVGQDLSLEQASQKLTRQAGLAVEESQLSHGLLLSFD